MLRKLSILCLSFILAAQTYAAAPESMSHADIVKKAVDTFMSENDVPGVVVELYVDGKPESYYFGYANPNIRKPMNKNTIFEVGSISKVMTSLLLAQEIDAAKMQLNIPVKNYVSTLSDDFDDITLMNLATHTAGLPINLPDGIKNQREMNQYLATFYPDYVPDEQWIYSNIGMGLLGFALEKVTHKNLNTLYQQHILAPLGMQPIGIIVPPALQIHYAVGFDKDGNTAQRQSATFLLPAAGAVKASAEDMLHFLSAAIGLPGTPESILYPMRMTQSVYVETSMMMQGLGWQVHPMEKNDIDDLLAAKDVSLDPVTVTEVYKKPLYSGDMLIDKTGQTNGFRSYIAVIPNKKTGIVILANKCIPGGAIVRTAREILFHVGTAQ